MGRAAQIVSEFTYGRSFAFPHSAEEYLAMAYDEMRELLAKAKEDQRETQRRLESMVHQRAVELSQFKVDALPPIPSNPEVWRFKFDPMYGETRMLSAHPSKWDGQVVASVAKAIADVVAGTIMERLREIANKPRGLSVGEEAEKELNYG